MYQVIRGASVPKACITKEPAATEFTKRRSKRIPNSGWVTSLYQRRGGLWLNVLFEHLLIPPPKPAEPAKG
jgi:hypothetical protein